MNRYYDETLSAGRLRRCYELAPPEVRAYLEAEIAFVLSRIGPQDSVLELGCGYGRVLERVVPHVRQVCGIDTSRASLRAVTTTVPADSAGVACMDAAALGFRDGAFDAVICIQNGISVFGVDPVRVVAEAVRVARPGGRVLFSSYAAEFWAERLAWFEIQAAHGLIGEIDRALTGDGVIVCRDGFRATTTGPEEFRRLASGTGIEPRLSVVERSSLFCELCLPVG